MIGSPASEVASIHGREGLFHDNSAANDESGIFGNDSLQVEPEFSIEGDAYMVSFSLNERGASFGGPFSENAEKISGFGSLHPYRLKAFHGETITHGLSAFGTGGYSSQPVPGFGCTAQAGIEGRV